MSLNYFLDKLKSEKAYVWGIPIPFHYFLLLVFIGFVLYGLHGWINRDNWKTLAHEQYGFVIDYPANWKHDTYGELGAKNLHDEKAKIWTNVLGFFGPTSRTLRIFWTPIEGATLLQTAEWGLGQLPQQDSIISDLKETQIGTGDYPALLRTIQYTTNSKMYLQYYVAHDNNAYLLEFYLRNENDHNEATHVFNYMLSSFRITD